MQDFLLLVMKKNYDEFELQDESFYEMNMESPPIDQCASWRWHEYTAAWCRVAV